MFAYKKIIVANFVAKSGFILVAQRDGWGVSLSSFRPPSLPLLSLVVTEDNVLICDYDGKRQINGG